MGSQRLLLGIVMANDAGMSAGALFEWARRVHDKGDRVRAEGMYGQVLEKDPRHMGALMMTASLLIERKAYNEALEMLGRAGEARPADPAPWNLLAVTLGSLNQIGDAEVACRQSLARKADQPQMQGFLGSLLLRLHRPQEAAEAFREVLKVEERNAQAHHGLACALRDMEDLSGATQACQKAVACVPEDAEPYAMLVQLLAKAGEKEKAVAVANAGLARFPGAEELKFARAAVLGEAVTTAPAGYVAAVFENHAETYDAVLVGELKAKSHEYVLEAVKAVSRLAGAEGERRLDILDMGCGTGLCGPLFRPLAKTLDGIDLSRAMVQKARARGVYDRLGVSDLVGFLKKVVVGSYDLLVAADVFVYVGDLAETFAEARRVLREGGMLAFTVEAVEGEGFRLKETMRFGHSLAYVEEVGGRSGLGKRYAEKRVLRNQDGKPVEGWVVVLQK